MTEETVVVSKQYLDYLEYMVGEVDFGPAHEDVIDFMLAEYVKQGGVIPDEVM